MMFADLLLLLLLSHHHIDGKQHLVLVYEIVKIVDSGWGRLEIGDRRRRSRRSLHLIDDCVGRRRLWGARDNAVGFVCGRVVGEGSDERAAARRRDQVTQRLMLMVVMLACCRRCCCCGQLLLLEYRVDRVDVRETLEVRDEVAEFGVVRVVEPRLACYCVVWVEDVRRWRVVQDQHLVKVSA